MFKLKLVQFRCWNELALELPLGKITLIKGNSGIGKTTILESIAWCLFGTLRLVAPNSFEASGNSNKAKTRVTIETPFVLDNNPGTLVIDRSKNPGRLVVTHGDKFFEDKVAQSLVDELFGTQDIWLASCYIGQGCRNNFLTAPPAGKMELLNIIAFHEEDPGQFIDKIDNLITETEALNHAKVLAYNASELRYQTLYANASRTVGTDIQSKLLTPEQIDVIKEQIKVYRGELDKLKSIATQRQVDLGLIDSLQRNLTALEQNVIEIPGPNKFLADTYLNIYGKIDFPEDTESHIAEIMSIIPLLKRRNELSASCEALRYHISLSPVPTQNYTKEDYTEALAWEQRLVENQKLAQSLGIGYGQEQKQRALTYYNGLIQAQERLILEVEKQSLIRKIGTLELELNKVLPELVYPVLEAKEIPEPNYGNYDSTSLQQQVQKLSEELGAVNGHLQHLKKGQDVLQCAHCKGALRYTNGSLTMAETGPTNSQELAATQETIRKLNMEIQQLTAEISRKRQAEGQARDQYTRDCTMEQRRLEQIKTTIQQLQLEQQKRDLHKQNLQQQLSELQLKYLEVESKLNQCPALTISPQDAKILSATDLDKAHGIVARLDTLTIMQGPPVSSATINKAFAYQDLQIKQAQAAAALTTHLESLPTNFQKQDLQQLETYLIGLRDYRHSIRNRTDAKLRQEKEKSSVSEQLILIRNRLVADPSEKITALKSLIAESEVKLQHHSLAESIQAEALKLQKEKESLSQHNKEMTDLHCLRQQAVETECSILQGVVDSINGSIQGVCSTLFDKEIQITLNLFKTLKTTKNTKPEINFTISYQGGSFDNIKQMSGGEGDRASLALTLALNRLSNCPLLMLDESLASLDTNFKEAAVDTIREHSNKTVLIIMHDGVEGIFDHVVDVNELK